MTKENPPSRSDQGMDRGSRGVHQDDACWSIVRGEGPILATAIHDGHGLRHEARALTALSGPDRLREEDPHTAEIIATVPTRVIVHRSRFEVDINRTADESVYRTPEQAWGLQVWQQPPDAEFVARSRRLHAGFYEALHSLLQGIQREHGSFVLLDVHSYNHRRDGPSAPASPISHAPDINIGTSSMPPGRWDQVIEAITHGVRSFDYPGRSLEVGIDVAFQGRGALTRFVHENFPLAGCAVALEVKKFFMDEWTGVPYRADIAALQRMFAFLLPALRIALART